MWHSSRVALHDVRAGVWHIWLINGMSRWVLHRHRKLVVLLRMTWVSTIYHVTLALIKVSLVLFYLEIFNSPGFTISAYCVLVFITINSLVIFFFTIFICTPVSFFWDRDIKGKCMDIQALAYAFSASAIVQDFVFLILLLVFIRNLQVKRYRKIGAAVMFSVGSFGCIITIQSLHWSNMGLRTHHHIDRIWACGGGSLRVVAIDPDFHTQDPARMLQKLPFAHEPTLKRSDSANTDTKQCPIIARRMRDASILDGYLSWQW
jgi:hypothetical protein